MGPTASFMVYFQLGIVDDIQVQVKASISSADFQGRLALLICKIGTVQSSFHHFPLSRPCFIAKLSLVKKN